MTMIIKFIKSKNITQKNMSFLNKSILSKLDKNLKYKKETIYFESYYSENIKKYLYFSILHSENPLLDDIEGKIQFDNGQIQFFTEIQANKIIINYLSDFPLSFYSQVKQIEFSDSIGSFTRPIQNKNSYYLAIFQNNWYLYNHVPHELEILSPDLNEQNFFHDFLLIDQQQQIFHIKEYLLKNTKNNTSTYYVAYDTAIELKKKKLKDILKNCDNLHNFDISLDTLTSFFENLEQIQLDKVKKGYKRTLFK